MVHRVDGRKRMMGEDESPDLDGAEQFKGLWPA
jgi:hypothetical protein